MNRTQAWSDNRLKVYRCPWRGEMVYVKGKKFPSPMEGGPGALLHASGEYRLRKLVGLSVTGMEDRSEEREDVAVMVRNLLKMVGPAIKDTLLGLELRLAIDENGDPIEYDSPLALYRGIIDLAEVGVTDDVYYSAQITDWKSYWGIEDPEDHATDLRRQLEGYAVLMKNHVPLEGCLRARAGFVRWGAIRSLVFGLKRIEAAFTKLKRRIDETEAKIAAGAEPIPGSWCATCHLAKACPIKETVIATGVLPIANEEDAIAAAGAVIAVAKFLGKLRESVREYTKVYGPLFVGDLEVGHLLPNDPSPEYDVLALMFELDRMEVPREVYLSPNKKALAAMLKNSGNGRPTMKSGGVTFDLRDGVFEALELIGVPPEAKPQYENGRKRKEALPHATHELVE